MWGMKELSEISYITEFSENSDLGTAYYIRKI